MAPQGTDGENDLATVYFARFDGSSVYTGQSDGFEGPCGAASFIFRSKVPLKVTCVQAEKPAEIDRLSSKLERESAVAAVLGVSLGITRSRSRQVTIHEFLSNRSARQA